MTTPAPPGALEGSVRLDGGIVHTLPLRPPTARADALLPTAGRLGR